MQTTLGRHLINKRIPEDMRSDSRVFNKKTSKAFFKELAEKHPEEYQDILHEVMQVGRVAATYHGRDTSVSINDLKLPPRLKEYRERLKTRIDAIAQNPIYSSEQKNNKIVELMKKAMPEIQEKMMDEGKGNSFVQGASAGYKANPTQIAQILFGDMLVADHKGRPIPIPGTHGYGQGVTPAEYWAGSYGSRTGYSAVQFATAQTGFLGKQLTGMAHKEMVTGEDCGAVDVGILRSGDDPEILGTVLAKVTKGIPAGTVVNKKILAKLRDEKVLIRSHTTCQQGEGVCQKCSGKRDQGEYPEVGSYLGTAVGRVVSEPITQGIGLSSKHSGGVVGLNDDVSGFDEVNQFVQVPKHFRGAAVLADIDGTVGAIKDAPQGGKYIQVGGKEIYVPPGREVEVKPGDVLSQGDILTDGTPNPREIAEYKGLGEGRAYFTDKYYDILKKNGGGTHKRNVETLAKAFFNRIRVTKEDGLQGYNVNDVVDYNEFQKRYQPREDARTTAPKQAKNRYLEKPYLHYTIGTRVTPRVIDNLREQGIDSIISHEADPGFKPEVKRVMDSASADSDWKVRMSGFGIQRSFLDAAQKGSLSKKDNTSYVPALMDPSRL